MHATWKLHPTFLSDRRHAPTLPLLPHDPCASAATAATDLICKLLYITLFPPDNPSFHLSISTQLSNANLGFKLLAGKRWRAVPPHVSLCICVEMRVIASTGNLSSYRQKCSETCDDRSQGCRWDRQCVWDMAPMIECSRLCGPSYGTKSPVLFSMNISAVSLVQPGIDL